MRPDAWYAGQGNAGLVAGGMAMLIHSDPRGELVNALWPAVLSGELSAVLAQLATQGLERLPDFALAVGRSTTTGNGLLILIRGTMSAHVFRGTELIDEVRAVAVTTWRETAFEDVDRVVLAAGAAAHLAGVGLPLLGGIVTAGRVELTLSTQSSEVGPRFQAGSAGASPGGAPREGAAGSSAGPRGAGFQAGGAAITREWTEPQAKPREPEPLRPITALFSTEPELPNPAPLPSVASPAEREPTSSGSAAGGQAQIERVEDSAAGAARGEPVGAARGEPVGAARGEPVGVARGEPVGVAPGGAVGEAASGAAGEAAQKGALLDRLSWLDGGSSAAAPAPQQSRTSSHFGDTVSRTRVPEASVAAVRCPKLHLNPPATPACRECLLPLDPTQEPFFVAQPVVGRLRRLDTDEDWPLSKKVTVLGRSPGSAGLIASVDLQLVTVTEVSHAVCDVHAEMRLHGWRLEVVDRSDRGGTMVTNPGDRPVRLEPGVPMRLLLGGQVRLADEVSFVFGL